MGLLMQSLKKSKAMKKAERAMCEMPQDFMSLMSHSDKKLAAFEELYDAMNEMPTFQNILRTTTPEELVEIADAAAWMLDRRGTDYLPISLVSFPKPLKYLLDNKEVVIGRQKDTNWQEIIMQAVTLL